jgi:hypothetical protein
MMSHALTLTAFANGSATLSARFSSVERAWAWASP